MFALFSTIGQVLTAGFQQWGETKRAKHKANLARIEASGKVAEIEATHTANWEIIQAKNSATSWKDEFLVLVLSAPLIGGFIPWLQPFIANGFDFIAQAPPWYQTAFLIAVSASFGLRIFPHIGRMMGKGK